MKTNKYHAALFLAAVGLSVIGLVLGVAEICSAESAMAGLALLPILGAVATLTPEQVKESVDELGRVWKSFQQENDKLLASGKQTQKEWNEKMEGLNARMDELDTKLNRRPAPQADDEAQTKQAQRSRTRAFLDFCRYGLEGMTPESKELLSKDSLAPEKKALSSSAGVEFLASPEMSNELIKGVVEFSPIRSVARVRTTSKKSVKIRKRLSTFVAVWVAKLGARPETTGLAYGLEEAPVHEMYAMVDVPFEDLEDSDFNLESELNLEFSEQFGVAEGKSSILGDSVGEMEGIATHAVLQTNHIISGDAALLTGNGLIDLYTGLKDSYAKNATWLLRRASIGSIRKLKDVTSGQYLWQPGLAGALPSTILDRPYVESPDMPAVGAGAYPVALGDFRRGYILIDRIQMAVLRDPFSQAGVGAVRFHARKRVGGQVLNTEAIKLQKVSA